MKSKSTLFIISLLILFCFVVANWGLFLSKWGIDLTDSGFFLYTQMRILNHKMTDISPTFLWIGSDWIGSLWLSFSKTPDLQFARLGSFVLYGIVLIIVSFTIFEITNDKKFTIIVTILSYLSFCSLNIFSIIDYDSAPLLPLSILFYLIVKLLYRSKNAFFIISLGAVVSYLLLSRISLVPMLIIYGFTFFYFKRSLKAKDFLFFITGMLLTFLILFSFELTRSNILLTFNSIKTLATLIITKKQLLTSFTIINSENHGFFDQLFYWTRGYLRFVIIMIFIIFILYLNNFSTKLFRYNIIFILLILTFTIYPFHFTNDTIINLQDQLVYNYILPSILFIIFIVIFKFDNENNFLLILLFFTMTFYPLGSNSFEKKIPLTFPIVIPILYTLFRETNLNKFHLLKNRLNKIFISTILILVIVNFFKLNKYPYRDLFITDLNSNFKEKSLYNIRTSLLKQSSIESVVHYLNNNKNKNSTLMSLGNANLFNYLTGIDGVFDYPNLLYLDQNYVGLKLDEMVKNNSIPEFIIYPLYDLRFSNWEVQKNRIIDNNGFYLHIQSFIKKNNYQIVFKNNYFKILSLNK
jgi:hypothetical protein